MKSFDQYCIKCNYTLPIGADVNRQYCDKCWKVHRRNYNRSKYQQKKYQETLKKFYSYQRIPLIQSPYLSGKRMIKVAQR